MNEEMSGELFDDHHDEQTTRIDADMHMHAGVEVIDDALQFNRRETGQSVMLENSQTEISSMLRRSKDYRPPGQNSGKRRGQMDKKLCKSIQNNIEMYFKRDYAKLKPQKEISTSRQKLVKTKKSVTKGPNVGSLGIGQVQTGTMKRHEINCSTHRVLKHGESVSLSQRGPSQTGTNSDRLIPGYVRSSTNVSPEKRSQFARSGIGFSSYSRQKSVRNLGVSEIMANSYEKNARIEKIISASTQNKEASDPHIQRGLMHSQGTLSTSTSKFLRPSKFNNSFKKSSKKELLTLEVNTPRSKLIKGEKTGKSGSFSKPINKGASSPKSIKAKLMSSTKMLPDSLCDAMSSSYIKNKGGSLTTNMIKMMDLSESHKMHPTSLDYTNAGNISSFTDLNSPEPGNAGSSNNSGSPVLTKGQRQVKVKSRFNRPIIIQNMEEGWKNLGSGYSLDKGKPKKNTGGSRLDLDGSHADEKHRDYKLNNMFKMIEFLEKDQNLTSHRLKIRQQIHEFKTVTEMTEANPEDRREFPELDEKYTIIKPLGEGSFAEVRLAVDSETNRYAIKIYSKTKIESKNLKKSIQHEVKLLKLLDHKNIIKIVEYIEGARYCYVVMEYGGPVSLREYLDTTEHGLMQESEAAVIFFELAKALVYLHSKHIYHRDLKLDNIMVGTAGQVKLVDFGLALGVKDNGLINSYCGTPCYMPPEIFSKKKYHPDKADVWSFGICLYRAVVGSFPFKGLNEANLGHMVKKGDFDIPAHISDELRTLILQLLAHCPSKRPSVSEILKFEWFKKSPMLESTVDTNINSLSFNAN